VTSRVVPAGPGSSCHSQEMSPGVPQIIKRGGSTESRRRCRHRCL
jgi:hypothetical protein